MMPEVETFGASAVRDELGREFKALRVSLTPLCNLKCVYCVGPDEIYDTVKPAPLPNLGPNKRWEEPQPIFEDVRKLHEICTFTKVRITGGEPTLYPSLVAFVELLSSLGIDDISLTTNATRLSSMAKDLKEAGLRRVNISLDTLQEKVFTKLNRGRKLDEVLAGIEASIAAGLKTRLNCTPLRGYNDEEAVALIDYALSKGIDIRFIELMKMGPLVGRHEEFFVPTAEILQKIKEKYVVSPLPRWKASTAEYWESEKGHRFGFISNHSRPFCSDCDRLRLSADGRIRGCITSSVTYDIRGKTKEEIRASLMAAIGKKNKNTFSGSENSMKELGG